MAEAAKEQGMGTGTKIFLWLIGVGIAIGVIYWVTRKPKKGAGKPGDKALNKSKALKMGDKGPEITQLQNDLLGAGNPMTISGTWDAATTTAINTQYAIWGINPPSPFTLAAFENDANNNL